MKDLLAYLDHISQFTAAGQAAFLTDEKTQFAVIRAYEVVGEIVKRLPESLRDANPHINWRRLMGFRDFLAHNYDEIILEFVWKAVEDLPNLRNAVQALLSQTSGDETQ